MFNVDEVASGFWRENCAAQTRLNCGLDKPADVTATWSGDAEALRVEFSYEGETQACELAVIGEHNVRNALAAVSLALLAGVGLSAAVSNLAGFSGVKGRLQIMSGPSRSRIVNDSYNANPESMLAAIETLEDLPLNGGGRKFIVLGQMAELGRHAEEAHLKVGKAAVDHGLSVVAVGEGASGIAEGAGSAPYFENFEEASSWLKNEVHDGDVVLFKGSRAAAVETLMNSVFPQN